MIARNEERDIGRAIKSFAPFADYFVLVDTGSTDRTVDVAHDEFSGVIARTYTDASEHVDGAWRLLDFGKARNESLKDAEATGADWIMWCDADDEIKTPEAIRRAMYWAEHDVFGVWIDGGGARWVQQRLWKAAKRVRFQGRCHEYPILDGLSGGQIDDGLIVHHADPDPKQENSNPRNLRILATEWAEGPNPRTAFYLANTYRDARRDAEAAEWYARRIEMDGYDHEKLFAYLYGARCLRSLGRHDEADKWTLAAIEKAPDWAEFRMEGAHGAYMQKDYERAAAIAARIDYGAPIPYTALWREPSMYRDQAPRLLSWCAEHLGNLAEAIAWGDIAAQLIGHVDADWDQRRARLMAQFAAQRRAEADPPRAPAIVKGLRQRIALHRPGAIGDILMTLNLVPALKAANQDCDVHYFCHANYAQPDALGTIMLAAGVDAVMDAASLSAFRAGYDRVVDLVGYPLAEGYPERPMGRHLLSYFGAELGIDVRTDYLPALTLPRPSVPDFAGDYATLQWQAGWSKYKQWPDERWSEVFNALASRGITIVRINEDAGRTLAQSIALFANARMHLGIDSFCNHLTNYYWSDPGIGGGARRVPGVILWGSTQATAAGYPHNVNISKGLHCQPCFRESPAISRMPRGPCINPPRATYDDPTPHACTAEIGVDEVVAAALELWERAK
jgi:glycosyltransferase involved in cell wall biosynthesis